jgi:hypothetical protein
MDDNATVYGLESWFPELLSRFDIIKKSEGAIETYITIATFAPYDSRKFYINDIDDWDRTTFTHEAFVGTNPNYKEALAEFKNKVDKYVDEKLNESEGKSILFLRKMPSFDIIDGNVVIKCRLSAGRIPNV